LEVLEFFLKGTAYWPTTDFWHEKILFLETSEGKPTVNTVKYALRGLGMQGVFDVASGLIFGRARDYTLEEKEELDKAITTIVAKEFNHPELPVVTNMDFGHTDPQWILPLGITAEIDCVKKTFGLIESPCK
jgi:muramoyltetrapeptide carboxypeptidase LdcA involved in peptidoglycan recycling